MDPYLMKGINYYGIIQTNYKKIINSERGKLIRDILAFIAIIKFGGDFIRTIREYGIIPFILEIIKIIKKKVFNAAKSIKLVKDHIDSEVDKNLKSFEKSLLGTEQERAKYNKFITLPQAGLEEDVIYEELDTYLGMAKHSYEEGKTSGSVYNADKQLTSVILKSMSKFAWANPLHPETFPGVRKMEAEIVAMVVDMYHGTALGACGTMTSGGTESIVMAMRAYKQLGRDQKGISSPHIIIPVTAHPAFDKASDYFGIRVTHVPVDPVTWQVDLRKVKQAICSNTVAIVGSCPSFPYGTQDDIVALSEIAIKNNIGLHVDCCLGGFIVPFMEAAGYSIPPFDFRVPGVTSISVDPHKYGCTPKGSSVVLYRTPDLRQYQYFSCTDWPGGVYASPSMAGSRPGNIIVGAWAAMVYIGRDQYIENTKKIVEKTLKMRQAVENYPELKIFGDPLGSILAFNSSGRIDIYRVAEFLEEKRWSIAWLQYPPGIHISVTQLIDEEAFIEDLAYAMAEIRKDPDAKATKKGGVYGSAAAVPDRSIIDRIARGFIDTLYTPL